MNQLYLTCETIRNTNLVGHERLWKITTLAAVSKQTLYQLSNYVMKKKDDGGGSLWIMT